MNLFAYGTLMDEWIMATVCGVLPANLPATLADYNRHPVSGEVYPALVYEEGARVEGGCYLDLPASAWEPLDLFEGEMYERILVLVSTSEGVVLPAETYLCKPEFRHVLDKSEWSFETFLKSGRENFKKDYTGFK